MKRTPVRRLVLPGLAVLALGVGTACGAANESGAGAESDLSGTLSGAGASSQEKAQEAWRTGFQGENPDVVVNYDPAGSSNGRTQFISGGVAFAGSDAYLTDDEGELSDATERCGGEAPIEIPAYVSPIAVVFNLDGVESLNLSPETVAKIFDGKITTWDDPAIAKENPDADLPSTKITPVHRSDGSGTTENFLDYLSQAAPDAWPHEVSDTFPAETGISGEGTSGLITAVKKGNGTIGYADASQAADLGQVSIKVGEDYVAPTADGAAKVIAVSPAVKDRPEVDMAVDVDRTTTEKGAYPIVLASYLIACQHYESAEEADLVKGYLSYVVSEKGQEAAAEHAGSAPLAPEVAERATEIVEGIAVS